MFTWIGSLGAVAFQSLDRIMVGMVLGASAAGTYAVASGIATRLYMLVSQFTQVLTPFASSYQEDSSQAQIQTAFRLSSRWGACILVMTASVLVMWMDTILNIWISPQFSEQYASLFRIMVIAYAVYSMAAPAYRIVVGLGWLKVPTAIMIVSGSCTLFMLWILTRNIGLVGAAYANFVYCIVLLINYYTAHRLGLKALAVVLADLGPPLIVLFLVVLVLNGNPTVEVRLSINIIVMAVISWMALSGRRAQLFLNAVRRQ
jgi:O-antigen/teichoic acid export membrane protein